MNDPEIDRILGDEPGIDPSPQFRTRVMRAVREEAVGPRPSMFPWNRIWPALVLASVLGPLFVPAGLVEGQRLPPELVEASRWFGAALIATWALASRFARWPGRAPS